MWQCRGFAEECIAETVAPNNSASSDLKYSALT
jgi:hypothetical protein